MSGKTRIELTKMLTVKGAIKAGIWIGIAKASSSVILGAYTVVLQKVADKLDKATEKMNAKSETEAEWEGEPDEKEAWRIAAEAKGAENDE